MITTRKEMIFHNYRLIRTNLMEYSPEQRMKRLAELKYLTRGPMFLVSIFHELAVAVNKYREEVDKNNPHVR